ncbi:MAG: hypothetical protein F6K28_35140 [Microcoleus sp. SIO2G3]|nr:hypothetical protein [Microcoleus sp. SIO2G3]
MTTPAMRVNTGPQLGAVIGGPYWASMLLQAHGVTDVDVTQLALLADSTLPIGDATDWVPPGASSRQDYSQPLPETANVQEAGTAAPGLINAVFQASSGHYVLVPLQTNWSPESIEALIALCQKNPGWEAVPLCNVQTGHLWGSRIALTNALAYLTGEEISPPKADWDVGHFVTLAGSVEGNQRSLLLVRDTYPIFGWDGYHLQPQDAIASALRRDDGKEGGVFLFVAAENQAEVEQQVREQGFDIASWDNGTPIRCDGQPQSS